MTPRILGYYVVLEKMQYFLYFSFLPSYVMFVCLCVLLFLRAFVHFTVVDS
jgi:hypothetical protein